MKQILSLFLFVVMLLSCFTACLPLETAPNETETESTGESKTETEAEAEEEWLLSRKTDLPDPDPSNVKTVPQDEIPGEKLEYRQLFEGRTSLYYPYDTAFLSEEEARAALSSLETELASIDFETEIVIRLVSSFSLSESDQDPNGIGLSQLMLSELVSKAGELSTCLLFIHEAPFNGEGIDSTYHYVTYLVVSKADLPQKQLQYHCLGYGTLAENVGTYNYSPMYTFLLPRDN